MIYLGIDPGFSGGIAGVGKTGELVWSHKWPEDDEGAVDLLMRQFGAAVDYAPVQAVAIERVWSSPQMGVVSAFTFGGVYHCARTLAIVRSWVKIEPTPLQWQTAMHCRTRGDKSITKAKAQALFPHVKVTNWSADALLLAEYCRLVSTGQLEGPTDGKKSSRKEGRTEAPVRRQAQWRREAEGQGNRIVAPEEVDQWEKDHWRTQSGTARNGTGPSRGARQRA